MARKSTDLTIINVFNWFSNVIDTQELKLADVGLLTTIIKNLNRNFWKPLKMSIYKIAKNSGSDDRTIRGALKRLAEKNILIAKIDGKFDKIENPADYFATKKFKPTDNDNYFSILQREGEFFIGIENRKGNFAKPAQTAEPDREQPQQTDPDPAGSAEQNNKVKTLASYL